MAKYPEKIKHHKKHKLKIGHPKIIRKVDLSDFSDDDIRLILLELDPRSFYRVQPNNCIIKLLNSQKFWADRLSRRLNYTSNRTDLNYKLIAEFLDNGESSAQNYSDALYDLSSNKDLQQIIDILIENNAVDLSKPLPEPTWYDLTEY